MGIFGRKRRDARTEAETEAEAEAEAEAGRESSVDVNATAIDAEQEADEPQEADEEPAFSRARGPFDRAEVDQDGSRLDLGALWVPAVEGMQVQIEMDEATQVINAVQVALDGSVAHLQAFAAPRSGALWPEIRTEIALSITAQGGSAEVVDGPLGRELAAKLPKNGPDVRFLGVEGPRWFLRAVISGPAATDDAAAARIVEAVRGTVVVRGAEAMAPRELLPLHLPSAPAPPADADGTDAERTDAERTDAEGPGGQSAREDLKPFERGPEITEVR